jgi:hypothetical protein
MLNAIAKKDKQKNFITLVSGHQGHFSSELSGHGEQDLE